MDTRILIGLVAFLLPTALALFRKHRNRGAIIVLNFACLAPLLYNGANVDDPQHPHPTGMLEDAVMIGGWLVALVWSFIKPREQAKS